VYISRWSHSQCMHWTRSDALSYHIVNLQFIRLCLLCTFILLQNIYCWVCICNILHIYCRRAVKGRSKFKNFTLISSMKVT
jgi:hypothetical protein